VDTEQKTNLLKSIVFRYFIIDKQAFLIFFGDMNTNENLPKTNARLNRIKKAAWVGQLLIGLTLPLSIYWMLAFLFNWPSPVDDRIRIVISHNHIYTSPADMPGEIFALLLVKIGLGIAVLAALFALFRLYGRGILFSARNILFIRFLGYCTIINWGIDYQMQSTLRDMDLSMTPVFVGLMIIFIAWVMDEGRKIQEEQELTV